MTFRHTEKLESHHNMSPNDIPRRRNGFTSPYNIPQISAWIALLATLLHFVLGITPILPLKASIPLTVFFLFLIGLVLLYGMRAIAVDSMDVYLEQHLRAHRNGTISKESRWKDSIYNAYNPPRTAPPTAATAEQEDDSMKQCWICDVQVVDSSMHCKYCNKCVGKFDHHCMCKWHTYRIFLSLFRDVDRNVFLLPMTLTMLWFRRQS